MHHVSSFILSTDKYNNISFFREEFKWKLYQVIMQDFDHNLLHSIKTFMLQWSYHTKSMKKEEEHKRKTSTSSYKPIILIPFPNLELPLVLDCHRSLCYTFVGSVFFFYLVEFFLSFTFLSFALGVRSGRW